MVSNIYIYIYFFLFIKTTAMDLTVGVNKVYCDINRNNSVVAVVSFQNRFLSTKA